MCAAEYDVVAIPSSSSKNTARMVQIQELSNFSGSSGAALIANVSGNSMRPTLRPGDKILIIHSNSNNRAPSDSCTLPKIGEIWAFWNPEGTHLIAHRAVRIFSDGSFIAQGDAMLRDDGRIVPARIFGRAEARFRGGKRHDLTSKRSRLAGPLAGLLRMGMRFLFSRLISE